MEYEAAAAGLKLELRSSGVVFNIDKEKPLRSLSGVWWLFEWLPIKRLSYSTDTGTTR